MIQKLFKEQTRYHLLKPKNTIIHEMKMRIDLWLNEEIGSEISMDQNDLKSAIKLFANQMKIVQKEFDSDIKDKQTKPAGLFEATKLQSAINFSLDDELIANIGSRLNSVSIFNPNRSLIALNSTCKICRTTNPGYPITLKFC